MISLFSIVITVFVTTISLGKCDSDWDYLLFSQRWPVTSCLEWKEVSEHNFCSLPKNNSHWIIHGIWPTKAGTEGPNFCKKEEFDKDALLPIMDMLEEKWTNVQQPSEESSFWKHEWLKHGSCAASLPDLNTEIKYFSKGLNLGDNNNIAQMLAKSGIVADTKPYSSQQVYNSVYQSLNKVPAIHCIHEKGTGKIYLSEIRICLNKSFAPIDCVGKNSGPIVNCGNDHTEENVFYPLLGPQFVDVFSMELFDLKVRPSFLGDHNNKVWSRKAESSVWKVGGFHNNNCVATL